MSLLKPFVHFWCSLRLTVVCLIAAMVLVFVGTLAQVDQGLYDAQKKYFRSYFLVPESIGGAGWAQIRIGGSEWVTPTNWSETEPSQFSLINFEARHGDNTATISVTKLAKNAGLLNNVNRWRGQLGLEKIDQAELTETTRPFEVDGNSGTYIEMSGTRDGRPAMTLGVIHSLSYRTLPELSLIHI